MIALGLTHTPTYFVDEIDFLRTAEHCQPCKVCPLPIRRDEVKEDEMRLREWQA